MTPVDSNTRSDSVGQELLAAAQDALQALVGVDRLLHEHGMMTGVECPAIAPLRAAIAKFVAQSPTPPALEERRG